MKAKAFTGALRASTAMLLLSALLVCVAYTGAVTLALGLAFPEKAGGSLVRVENRVVGSALLGQEFTSPGYFWSRPSATRPPYNAAASAGSNLSPANPALLQAVQARIGKLRSEGRQEAPVPVDLVTASGSGLDPHISLAAAEYQVPRVAKARRLPEKDVFALVWRQAESSRWPVLGQPRVNVMLLNLALDRAAAEQKRE